jgi:hypothetical protein
VRRRISAESPAVIVRNTGTIANGSITKKIADRATTPNLRSS